MSTKNRNLAVVTEGAVMVAAAYALSFIKIPLDFMLGSFGGSIDFVMVPLIIYSLRRGFGWGLGAGFIFGTLNFFFAGGAAVNWVSMLLDYSVAYAAVGFAGIAKDKPGAYYWGPFVGCFARFIVHYISGVTIYASFMPDVFLGIGMKSTAFYSLLYNGTYMLPNTVMAVALCAVLSKPMRKVKLNEAR